MHDQSNMNRKGWLLAAVVVLGVAVLAIYLSQGSIERARADASVVAGDPEHGSPAMPPPADGTMTEGELWADQLSSSKNLLTLVADAAGPAMAGDHEAQAAIGRAFALCRVSIALANSSDTAAASAVRQGIPVDVSLRAKAQRDRCTDLVGEKSIQGFPKDKEAYEEMYWFRMAEKGGIPVAVSFVALERAVHLAGIPNSSPAEIASNREVSFEIERRLDAMVRSGDPRTLPALAGVFNVLLDSERSRDKLVEDKSVRAAAWTLMACRQADCLDASVSKLWATCPPNEGTGCDGVTAIVDEMRMRLGREQFSRAEVLSYEIEASMKRGAWGELDLSI